MLTNIRWDYNEEKNVKGCKFFSLFLISIFFKKKMKLQFKINLI